MAMRLEIGLKPHLEDPAGNALKKKAKDYLNLKLEAARVLRVLTFETGLSRAELDQVKESIFVNPVSELGSFSPLAEEMLPEFDFALWEGFKPGVRDNQGATAIEAMSDALGRRFFADEAVYSSRLYLIKAPRLTPEQARLILDELLMNPIIQEGQVICRADWDGEAGIGIRLPKVSLEHKPSVKVLKVESDQGLMNLSLERNLFLNPADIPVIRAYFDDPQVKARRLAEGLEGPTDVELEYISQARSDHCNHNTFNGRFVYRDMASGEAKVVENLFKECIKGPTEELAATRDWVVSVLWDNAGVARLDETCNYVITGETHNSPSNMEAYGGAITGIVGVYRDPMGTGLGAKLIAGMWGYCVGPRDYEGDIVPVLHPRRLLDGVIEGVRDGGNKSGIPTTGGLLRFDERHLGKCLVFVSALGVIPDKLEGKPAHEKTTSPGELVIMCGGRVGADGIHGVTASSAGYSGRTPAGHVQIGDPYTQKKMHDFLLEARDQGLINYITDNGGGGLSSSVGESARLSPGAEVDLKKVPLKYQGLDPWQIWVSESQERMTVAVHPDNRERFMALSEKHNVESTVIGSYGADGMLRLTYGDDLCAYVDVAFLEEGFSQWEFDAHWLPPASRGLTEPVLDEPEDAGPLILSLLNQPNLCSRAWINRQYDHEVQGTSVIKPLIGRKRDIPADASVIQPRLDGPNGLAMAAVLLPEYGDIDTYHMIIASVEEGFRRVVAAGGDPLQVGGVDNFCWPSIQYHPQENPDGRYKAAQLVRACWGLKDACLALGIPLLSGKDSMYVDGVLKTDLGISRRVSGPPTMMFTATAPVPGLNRCQTLDPKMAGDTVYMLGETRNELGASALYELLGHTGLNLPEADFSASLELALAVSRALDEGVIASIGVVSRGGLAYTLAKMALASELGLSVNLHDIPAGPQVNCLGRMFSESTGRMVVTVDPAKADRFERLLDKVAWAPMGQVTGDKRLKIRVDHRKLADLGLAEMRRSFHKRFGSLV